MPFSSINQHSQAVLEYIKRYDVQKASAWLLAISGGLDSMVLLHAFFELSERYPSLLPSQIVVMHVNHGLRKEAYKDLELIQNYVKARDGFCLEACNLDPNQWPEGNIEALAREARYDFFHQVSLKYKACHLFLAHHLQDRRESLLKNIFEGKELAYLDSLRPHHTRGHLQLLRPFLAFEKEELFQIASVYQIPFEEDRTNHDQRFLRARMRKKLEPLLDEIWPTSWKKGLSSICYFLEESRARIDQQIDPSSRAFEKGVFGYRWTLPKNSSESAAIRFWLRELSSDIDPLEREGSMRLSLALLEKRHNFKYRSKNYLWCVNGSDLFALNPEVDQGKSLKRELEPLGFWNHQDLDKGLLDYSWKSFWKGSALTPCFKIGEWARLDTLPSAIRRSILHRYQNHHIPSFLRAHLPVWWSAHTLDQSVNEPLVWTVLDQPSAHKLEQDGVRKWTWASRLG